MAATSWYRTGTVSVTNGSDVVTGTNTLWVANVNVGDIFVGPDKALYEVVEVTDNITLRIQTLDGIAAYQGATGTALTYAVVRSFTNTTNADLAARLSDMINKWHGREDEFVDWLAGTPSGGSVVPANSCLVGDKLDANLTSESACTTAGGVWYASDTQLTDGRYKMTDPLGQVYYVKAPATLQNDVDGTVNSARTYRDEAQAARDDAVNIRETLPVVDKLISSSTTIVDVCIYDTRKDSDGGAWRKRSQHTSWYNETLNTATRGAKREFPAMALIVVEQAAMTIYDLTDPAAPMWMVFTLADNYMLNAAATSRVLSSVAAENGVIAVGCKGGASNGLFRIDFLHDEGIEYGAAYQRIGGTHNKLSSRNIAASSFITLSSTGLGNDVINDVAITVLDDAPIDAETSLPVPTIAVGTDDRGAIIQNDGTITTIGAVAGEEVDAVEFLDGVELCAFTRLGHAKVFAVSDGVLIRYLTTAESSASTPKLLISGVTPRSLAQMGQDYAIGSDTGLSLVKDAPSSYSTPNVSDAMVAFVTSQYNSGWLPGDIRLATLADTTAETISGTELVTNGTFDVDTSGWTAINGATLSVSAGVLRVTNTGTPGAGVRQAITTVAEETYTLSFDHVAQANTGGTLFRLGTTAGGNDIAEVDMGDVVGTHSYTFTAQTTTTYLEVVDSPSALVNETFDIDNVSLRLAVADRSQKGNGAQVFGSLVKTAVAPGAELVSYSGFTSANYLAAPYTPGLDFGTGDFYFIAWVRGVGKGDYIIDREVSGGAESNRVAVLLDANGWATIYTYDGVSVGGSTSSVLKASAAGDISASSEYRMIVFTRESDGRISMYLDGRFIESTVQAARDISNPGATLFVGINYQLAYAAAGDIALLRMGAGKLTANQVRYMYQTERHLFGDNVACTIDGTSDSVNALAYDAVNRALHVGTPWGRSEMRGLRRVASEATPVGSIRSISSDNGAIAQAGAAGADIYLPAHILREELDSMPSSHVQQEVFWFTGDGVETAYPLPAGWRPKTVHVAGAIKRESTDYTVAFDGFAYTVTFTVAPALNDDIAISAQQWRC